MTGGFKENAIFWIEVDKIKPNPYQPRKEFDEEALKSLAESIKQYGVLQPLVVTRKEEELEDGGMRVYYELVAGERRLRAAKLAGLNQVPVIIRDKEDSDQEKLELAIIENLQREDLNPIDRALAFKRLYDEFGMTHAQIAKKIGKSREYVSNALRLLTLPEDIQRAIANGIISEGHARPLLMLTDKPEEQETLFKEIVMKKLTVREAEHIARSVATEKLRKHDIPPELRKIEKELSENLGTRVRIEQKEDGVGRVHIDFTSKDDLQHLLELVKEHKRHSIIKQNNEDTQQNLTAINNLGAALGVETALNVNDTSKTFASKAMTQVENKTQDQDFEIENLGNTFEDNTGANQDSYVNTNNNLKPSDNEVSIKNAQEYIDINSQDQKSTEQDGSLNITEQQDAMTASLHNDFANNYSYAIDNNLAEVHENEKNTTPKVDDSANTNSNNSDLDWQEILKSGFDEATEIAHNSDLNLENESETKHTNSYIENTKPLTEVTNPQALELENQSGIYTDKSVNNIQSSMVSTDLDKISTYNELKYENISQESNEPDASTVSNFDTAQRQANNIETSSLEAFANAVENTIKHEQEKSQQLEDGNNKSGASDNSEFLPPELRQINERLQNDIEKIMNTPGLNDNTKGTGVEFKELSEEELSMPGYDGPKTKAQKNDIANNN